MTNEYERYKSQWGLNLHYDHNAGPARNFSELQSLQSDMLQFDFSAAKKEVELQLVHIYIDSATFDRVEKDIKVCFTGGFIKSML